MDEASDILGLSVVYYKQEAFKENNDIIENLDSYI